MPQVRDYWLDMYLGVALLEIFLFAMALLAVRWPSVPLQSFNDETFEAARNIQVKEHKICLLIAHYGAYGPLRETLEAALRVFPPDHIFVCHNAGREHPYDSGRAGDTLKEIRALEKELQLNVKINYSFNCEGNKTLAVYCNALKLCGQMNYCMMIDNDVLLPHDLVIPMEIFSDPQQQHVKALSFTIKACNPFNRSGTRNWVAAMQDIEYKRAGDSRSHCAPL